MWRVWSSVTKYFYYVRQLLFFYQLLKPLSVNTSECVACKLLRRLTSNTLHLDRATGGLIDLTSRFCLIGQPKPDGKFLVLWLVASDTPRFRSWQLDRSPIASQQDRHVWWLCSPWLSKIAPCCSATNLHLPGLRCCGQSESSAREWAGRHSERGDVESREGDHVEAGSSNPSTQQPEPWVAPNVVVGGKINKEKVGNNTQKFKKNNNTQFYFCK